MTAEQRQRLRIELTDDDGRPTGETIPLGNDRMWSLELHNRGRIQTGTLPIYRLYFLCAAIVKRYPEAVKSRDGTEPVVWRCRRGGPVVAVIDVLSGPVASIATKH